MNLLAMLIIYDTVNIAWGCFMAVEKYSLERLPGAPQDEAGLRRKFETSHVGGF